MGMTSMALAAAGTTMSAAGKIQQGSAAARAGQAQQQAADYQAAQLTQQAGQTRASSQRTALDQRRQATLVESRAQALAAASGGGAADPTVSNIEGTIAGRGEYDALSALFSGEERARGLEDQAAGRTFEGAEAAYAGRQRQRAADIGAVGSLASGAGSLFAKYGGVDDGSGMGSAFQQRALLRQQPADI